MTTPGRPPRRGRPDEGARRIRHSAQAALGHLEDADLLGRAVAVLRPHAGCGWPAALAFQREHGVDEVLERLRSGQAAVLGHLADEHDRDPARASRSSVSRSADSRTCPTQPGRSVELFERDASGRSRRSRAPVAGPRDLDDAPDVGLGQHVHRISGRTLEPGRGGAARRRAGRPTPRPTRRARSRPAAASPAASLEHERRLADARLTAEEDHRTRDEPAAEHPVELADARRAAADVGRVESRGVVATAVGARPARRAGGAPTCGSSARGSRRGVSQAPQPRHCPSQRRWLAHRSGRRIGSALGRARVQDYEADRRASTRRSSSHRERLLLEQRSRPRLGSLSTTTVCPAGSGPSSSASASGSSTMFWMTRRSGRAP